jgi:hypothetical protein
VSVRYRRLLITRVGLLAIIFYLSPHMACANEPISYLTVGTQTVGFAVGPFFPIRVVPNQSSDLLRGSGNAVLVLTITDPIGSNRYRGQVSFGAKLPAFGTSEPLTGYGVGITLKLQYTLVGLHWLRPPYIEGGRRSDMDKSRWPRAGTAGPVQLCRPGRSRSCMDPDTPMCIEYRLPVRPRTQNSGLNFGLPFAGLSYSIF